MVVTCPSCGMRYRRPDAVSPEARTARCARCDHAFPLPPAAKPYRIAIGPALALATGSAPAACPVRTDPIAHLEAALDEIGPLQPGAASSDAGCAALGTVSGADAVAKSEPTREEAGPKRRPWRWLPDPGGVVQATLVGAAAGWVIAPDALGLLWVGPASGAGSALVVSWGYSLWASRRS